MYTYRIVLDAYDSRGSAKGARVVTYSQGWSRVDALSRLRTVNIAADGTVSDGITPWPGSNNLPAGPHVARGLPEWDVVSMRAVAKPGKARILAE